MPNGKHLNSAEGDAREAYPIAEISAIGEVQRELGANIGKLMEVLSIALKPEEPEERNVKQEEVGGEVGRSILYTQLCGVRSTAEALNRSVLSIMERLDF